MCQVQSSRPRLTDNPIRVQKRLTYLAMLTPRYRQR